MRQYRRSIRANNVARRPAPRRRAIRADYEDDYYVEPEDREYDGSYYSMGYDNLDEAIEAADEANAWAKAVSALISEHLAEYSEWGGSTDVLEMFRGPDDAQEFADVCNSIADELAAIFHKLDAYTSVYVDVDDFKR